MSSAPFKKILVANRGEIALRVICACKELGIPTVAVYSEADRYSLPVRFADEAICIGPAKSARSYLDIPSIISAAEITNTDAIHPGYGFLSENAGFRGSLRNLRHHFYWTQPEVIQAMGIKERARAIMRDHGVPDSSRLEPACSTALKKPWNWPRRSATRHPQSLGRRRRTRYAYRNHLAELPALLAQAQNEAGASFSSADVYLEKFVSAPRHIEFQILADQHGNVEMLGERECSIQRRHQKLLEESPSPALSAEVRQNVSAALSKALCAIGYTNAGTVEFLMDETGQLYFIEVNARIQVEHPVTEMVTGIDLVKAQIRIAAGEKLADILDLPCSPAGHAIECRINAENPDTFTPSPGRITGLNLPGGIGVRVDTHAYTDGVIPPYYDSLVAKLIAHGRDRHGSDRADEAGAAACLSSKASTRRSRCTRKSWRIPISWPATSTPTSLSASASTERPDGSISR